MKERTITLSSGLRTDNMSNCAIKNFSLQHTLESGQFFLYEKVDDWYYIITTKKVFKVKQNKHRLYYDNISRKELFRFLGLSVPYDEILGEIGKDKAIKKYMLQFHGLRVMQYDPWICTISFLCSSASNIPKIRRTLFSFARRFGKKVVYGSKAFFLFPSHGELGTEKELRACGAGFRAKAIAQINAHPLSFFHALASLPYPAAKQILTNQYGIGEKIADCILLFAYNRWQAFPIDVWIERALLHHYNVKDNFSDFVPKQFPQYAGYAQQFLYHGFRLTQQKSSRNLL